MTITTAQTWHTPRRFVLIAAAMMSLGASLAACSGTGNQPGGTNRSTAGIRRRCAILYSPACRRFSIW